MFTILMLISHTISDFVTQTNEVVELKSKMKLKGYLYHAAWIFIISIVMIFFTKSKNVPELIEIILEIVAIHIFIDFLKELGQKYILNQSNAELKAKKEIVLFLFDQLIHIITILLITRNVTLKFNMLNKIFLETINSSNPFTEPDFKIIFMILYIALSGAYLIPLIFNLIYAKVDNYNNILNKKLKEDLNGPEKKFVDEVKTGKWIGILERMLISALIYKHQYTVISYIIAIKSLARFKMLDNKIFSEYYLLGTLFSVVYTFFAYYIFNKII